MPGRVIAFGTLVVTVVFARAEPVTSLSGLGEPLFEFGYTQEEPPFEETLHPAQSSFDHGNPSDYEQLMLELINRARAAPGAEAARLGIDLNQGLDPGTISDCRGPLPARALSAWCTMTPIRMRSMTLAKVWRVSR